MRTGRRPVGINVVHEETVGTEDAAMNERGKACKAGEGHPTRFFDWASRGTKPSRGANAAFATGRQVCPWGGEVTKGSR